MHAETTEIRIILNNNNTIVITKNSNAMSWELAAQRMDIF